MVTLRRFQRLVIANPKNQRREPKLVIVPFCQAVHRSESEPESLRRLRRVRDSVRDECRQAEVGGPNLDIRHAAQHASNTENSAPQL